MYVKLVNRFLVNETLVSGNLVHGTLIDGDVLFNGHLVSVVVCLQESPLNQNLCQKVRPSSGTARHIDCNVSLVHFQTSISRLSKI